VDTNQVAFSDGTLLFGDTSSFVKARLSPDSVARALATEIRAISGVHRVDMLTDLARADTVRDTIAVRWLRVFAQGGQVRFVTTLKQYNYSAGTTIATHGSPWDQDAWVPVIFWGAPFTPGKYGIHARVVDMAPTLANMLGIKPLERLDGIILRESER